jgi:putative flippase GtrA
MASEDAAQVGRWRRLARFGAVGASGAIVNLAGLHLLAGMLGLPELAASALAIELSVLWNFGWNDAFTFRDRRSGAWPARLARYHLVSAVGVALQLAVFAAGLAVARRLGAGALGVARYPVQAAGIALGFAWNFLGASRWAWRARPGRARPFPVSRARRSPVSLPAALFAALLALHVALLWSIRWFATQDGPLHVENVVALLHQATSPLLQRYYVANWGAQPNWLTQLLLMPLLQVVSPRVAERLVLTGYTLLLPVAFRSVLPRGRAGWWASLAVFPFLHSFPFFMGFWNFLWGMALALLVVGAWQRARGRLGPRRLPAMAALGACLYAAHAVAFGAACLAMGALLASRALPALARARRSPARWRRVGRAYAGRALGLGLALAPGAVLLGAWMLAHRDHVSARIPLAELLAKLGAGYVLVSIDRRELFLSVGVTAVLGIAVLAAVRRRLRQDLRLRWRPWDGWLAAAALFAVLYFAIPDVADAGAHISDRFALLAFLSAAAWLGGPAAAARPLRTTGLALAALAVAALAVRFEKERVLSAYVEEYVSVGPVLGQDSVVLPLALAPNGPRDARGRKLGYRVKPFLHATGWIVAAQGGVDLKNSQANTDQCPVRFAPDRNPFQTIAASIGRMEGVPPCVDLRLAPRVGPLDYVLVWGATRENLETPCGAALAEELTTRYEPVWLSEPHGLLEVWRPRVETAAR